MRDYIVEGSTVRKRQTAPKRVTRVERHAVTYTKASRRAEASKSFDRGYTAVLVAMLAVVAFSCLMMLTMQSSVASKEQKIESLQSELQTLESGNIALESELNNMYSLQDIYEVASNQLGMVFAENGQIIYYEPENGDYVKQYEDVPRADD